MEKTEILLEHVQNKQIPFEPHMPKQQIQKNTIPWKQMIQLGICWVVPFFWSKLAVLQILHPLGMGILSAFFGSGYLFWVVWTAVFVGSFGNGVFLKHIAVYLAAMLLYSTLGRFLT